MLNEGEIVKLGEKDFKVVTLAYKELPCLKCAIKNCYKNKEFDAIKAKHAALSCIDLIPLNSRFEEVNVELAPQVVYKYKPLKLQ